MKSKHVKDITIIILDKERPQIEPHKNSCTCNLAHHDKPQTLAPLSKIQ